MWISILQKLVLYLSHISGDFCNASYALKFVFFIEVSSSWTQYMLLYIAVTFETQHTQLVCNFNFGTQETVVQSFCFILWAERHSNTWNFADFWICFASVRSPKYSELQAGMLIEAGSRNSWKSLNSRVQNFRNVGCNAKISYTMDV